MERISSNATDTTYIRELINRSRYGWGRVDFSKLLEVCLHGPIDDLVAESTRIYQNYCRNSDRPNGSEDFHIFAPLEDQIIREIAYFRIVAQYCDISNAQSDYDQSDLDIYGEAPPTAPGKA